MNNAELKSFLEEKIKHWDLKVSEAIKAGLPDTTITQARAKRDSFREVLNELNRLDTVSLIASGIRAYTPEELRELLLGVFRSVADQWSKTIYPQETKCYGIIHSVLAVLDGANPGLPTFELVALPADEDKDYCIETNQNWVEPGTKLGPLHDYWYTED